MSKWDFSYHSWNPIFILRVPLKNECGEVFQIDETGYDQIARQIRDKEFSKEIERRERELEAKPKRELA